MREISTGGYDRDNYREVGWCVPQIQHGPIRDCAQMTSTLHKETIPIAFHHLAEKIPEHSVTNRRVGPFHKRFRRKHWVFARFVSVRLLRIPRHVLRFYYARSKAKMSLR